MRPLHYMSTMVCLALVLSDFAGATAANEELARELSALRREERQLLRDADQYRESLLSLEFSNTLESSRETAMQALQNQLKRANAALADVAARKARLRAALGAGSGDAESDDGGAVALSTSAAATAPAPRTAALQERTLAAEALPAPAAVSPPAPSADWNYGVVSTANWQAELALRDKLAPANPGVGGTPAPDAAAPYVGMPGTPRDDSAGLLEVSRLTQLLASHYEHMESPPADGKVDPVATADPTGRTSAEIDLTRVLLSDRAATFVINRISRRLAADSQSSLREPDVIMQVEARVDGNLVSSRSHSLKALGNYQFANMVQLPPGDLTIRLRTRNWSLTLPDAEAGHYLVTLHLPAYATADLHVIPAADLQTAAMVDPPAWLPDLGITVTDVQ